MIELVQGGRLNEHPDRWWTKTHVKVMRCLNSCIIASDLPLPHPKTGTEIILKGYNKKVWKTFGDIQDCQFTEEAN